MPSTPTKHNKDIYDTHANSGPDGEKLAAEFRKAAVQTNLVKALNDARKSGNLVEKARELLMKKEEAPIKPAAEEEIKLNHICWCWIQPNTN